MSAMLLRVYKTISIAWRCLFGCTAKKRQTWERHSARSFTARDKDVTTDVSVTSSASSSRAHKKRQMAGTETDIMHQMLFPASKPPLPSSQSNEQKIRKESSPAVLTDPKPIAAERRRVRDSCENVADLAVSDAKTKDRKADSDDESNASADTYTIDSDDKEELRQERARIDVAFGIVSGSASDERRQPPTDNSDTHLPDADVDDDDDGDLNESSLRIHEDSDEADQPRLKRTKNQILFSKYTEESASSGCVSKPDTLDVNGSVTVGDSLDDTNELVISDRDISVTPDEEARQSESRSSQSSPKSSHSKADGIPGHDQLDVACARQNDGSDAAGTNNVVAESEEPMSTKNLKADASFGDDGDDEEDDDDDDGSQPAAVSLFKETEDYHEVKGTNLL